MFSQNFNAKIKKFSKKEHIFALFPNASATKKPGLKPLKTGDTHF